MEANVGLFAKDGGAIPLIGVEIEGEVLGAHTRVRVRQRYRNGEAKPVEAVYTFPLPSLATLIGFAMTCDGRRIEGVVKEREAAFAAYDDAVTAGHGAALLDQERPNVFTASVGNLLPGEETLVEIEYVERVQVDEGALRLMIPTLVAPRYIPGAAAGDRTAGGWADPTDRVPDADRITPRIGDVAYGLRLDLRFQLGCELELESPSHEIVVTQTGGIARVRFKKEEVALDRDLVLVARGISDAPLAAFLTHRERVNAPGFFSLTVIPDLGGQGRRAPRQDVVFVIDRSGSMEGSSLIEAQAALRLCLRHLREGDRFNVISFDDSWQAFQPRTVAFTQRTLEEADRWVSSLHAGGGTEILAPLREAAAQAPDGVIVLLTDGQVGNEQEILDQVVGAARGRARLYPFGIGTNVSDYLLRELARRSGGAVEFIHPGERIDEKVVAQFARAIAPRVTELSVKLDGVEVGELAPAEAPPLVDGEPWVIFGRLESGLSGRAELRGKLDGEPFALTVPFDCGEPSSHPALGKLWAAERIRDLQSVTVSGRRQERMQERIEQLSVEHGVMSSLTSFVVIETRTGARRAGGQPETRTIPVSLPAGWAMFEQPPHEEMLTRSGVAMSMDASLLRGGGFGHGAGGPPPAAAPAQMAAPAKRKAGVMGKLADLFASASGAKQGRDDQGESAACEPSVRYEADGGGDPLLALLGRQLASGLWDEGDGIADDEVRRMRATSRALLELLDLGVNSSHPLHGTQVKKAVAALLHLAPSVATREPQVAELALGVAWLVASGRRTRREIESAVAVTGPLAGLRVWLSDEHALRAHLNQLSAP